ncbi:hypothetical protein CDO51_01945 [Natranaerobius trueperi]|uniref:TldD/PmbA family protein n=1 Tax=Natranaerobius trueperi TaxID=759412 RepID=A0A226C0L8_9FIRM|nr:hypothetical protein CDO51_01945 [Natranaerobius trueperi]
MIVIRRYVILKEYLQSALKGKKADYIEIRVQKSHNNILEYQGKELDRIDSSDNYGGCVRAFFKGGVGFVSFNNMDDISDKVDLAITQAQLVGKRIPDKTNFAEVEPIVDYVYADLRDDPFSISLTRKKELLEEYNDIILSYGNPIASSRISYFDNFTTLYYINNQGTYIEQEKVDLGGNIVALATDENTTQMSRVGFGGGDDFGVVRELHDKVKVACDKAVKMINAKPITGGKYPVILDPTLAGVFVHEAFGHLSESDHIYENKKLQEIMQLGTKFGGEHLNIYDTGNASGARGYLKYDDEGVPTQKLI